MPPRKKITIVKKKCKQVKSKSANVKKRKSHLKTTISPSAPLESNLERPETSNTVKKCKHYLPHKAKSTVNRLLSPFHKFETMPLEKKQGKISNNLSYEKTSLNPKERNYLVCSCQKEASRYKRLKCLAAEAIKNRKLFIVRSGGETVRKALVSRGWVEKIPPNRMDLSTIRSKKYKDPSEMHLELERLLLSNLVEKSEPNFIWNAKDNDYHSDKNKIIYNKLTAEALWTSKHGLCSSIRNNHWHYIENIAEVNSPRTYTTFGDEEKDDFERDYKLTACTSLLKWVLSMDANNHLIFSDSGKISINIIVFAINRCKEYVFSKQNKDIDKNSTSAATNGQWNSFLKKYYILLAKKEVFRPDIEKKLPLYLCYAKYLLKEVYKYRPQLSCEGCHNVWIIKPAHCSRGRGIRMASKLAVLKDLMNRGKYVLQKYIEEPLLIHETKFDIRQYYIITSTFPLVIWMYKDCYLKFSSQKYNLQNYHESIHLTNNAVQKRYKNCLDRHDELPQYNMWSLDTFKEHLCKIDKEDVWEKVIYAGMKKTIVGVMLSCQESLSNNKNRFELYGCDFILDKDYSPWLIEINSKPDLNHTTKVTATICPAVIDDMIKVVIDYPSNAKAPTGKFECIYHQTVCGPPLYGNVDLMVRGLALPLDYFYRGDIPETEAIDDVLNIEKQQDVNAMLHKIKSKYEAGVMVLPESSSQEREDKKLPENTPKQAASDEELQITVNVITGQLDELMDRITSGNGPSGTKSRGYSSVSFPSSNNLRRKSFGFSDEKCVPYDPKSLTGIDTLLKKSVSRFASLEALVTRTNFDFSELDDGSYGKGSGSICLNTIKNINSIESLKRNALNRKVNNADLLTKEHIKADLKQSNFEDATSKLLSFLEKKTKEYRCE